jgi:hypothetical protein
MSAWIVGENFLKIRTADGKNDFMALKELSIARDCAVYKITAIEKTLKAC